MSQHIRVHASRAIKCNERWFIAWGLIASREYHLFLCQKKLFHNLEDSSTDQILNLFFNNYKFESFQNH